MAHESRWTAWWTWDGAEGSGMMNRRRRLELRSFDMDRPGTGVGTVDIPREAAAPLLVLETGPQEKREAGIVLRGREEGSRQAERSAFARAVDGGPHDGLLHPAPQHPAAQHAVDEGGGGSGPLQAEEADQAGLAEAVGDVDHPDLAPGRAGPGP